MLRISTWIKRRNRTWWISFALIGALGCTWSLANPLFATSDEGSHVVRAAGVSYGELVGDELSPEQEADLGWGVGGRQGPQPSAHRSHDIPAIYGTPNWSCFVFQPDVTPNCLFFNGSRNIAPVVTAVPTYPPLYYAIVGTPARFADAGSRSVYFMRFTSSFLCAALLASAFETVRRARNRLPVLGVMTAITPLVLYLGASVNPSGFEIAAGIGFWTSGIAVIATPSARLVTRTAVAGSMLALSRHLGPLWVVLIAAVLALYAGRDNLRSLLRNSAVRRGAVAVGGCILAQAAWVFATDALSDDKPIYSGESNLAVSLLFRRDVGAVYQWYRQMTGMFLGWGETLPPAGTFLIWTTVLAAILTLSLLLSSRHQLATLGAAIAIAVGVPFAIDFGGAAIRGNPLVWQARHGMALAVGIPILAAFSTSAAVLTRRINLLAAGFAALLGLATALAFWSALRRYTVGQSGRLSYWVNPEWTPPVAPWLLTILFPGFLVAIGVHQWRSHVTTAPESV